MRCLPQPVQVALRKPHTAALNSLNCHRNKDDVDHPSIAYHACAPNRLRSAQHACMTGGASVVGGWSVSAGVESAIAPQLGAAPHGRRGAADPL